MKIAISKGRIFEETIAQLSQIDIHPQQAQIQARKLIIQTNRPDVELVIVRASDVPTYVSTGALTLGVVGKDVLMENEAKFPNLFELMDLGTSQCKIVLASKTDQVFKKITSQTYHIATKYPHITQQFFSQHQADVNITKLYGSMELAPVLGLSDYIVDIMSSGKTLQSNGLKPLLTMMNSSARLVTNRCSMHFSHQAIQKLVTQLQQCVS